MPPMTGTGDISYRTAGFVCAELLKRAQPLLAVSRLGQNKPIPKNSGDTIKFRGYEALDTSPKVLIEGVTPTASKPTFRDVVAKLEQYGDYIEITDKLSDTIEDPVWGEFTDILGEQSGIMLERVVINKLLAGTNVFFSGSTGGDQPQWRERAAYADLAAPRDPRSQTSACVPHHIGGVRQRQFLHFPHLPLVYRGGPHGHRSRCAQPARFCSRGEVRFLQAHGWRDRFRGKRALCMHHPA